uniref:Toxin 3FTx-Oxy5 n=1 Tax=Oxyuranus microlepidotus TaxID=111177 RepID=3SX5_OXYMI|nr:RecName: Full=Toxin 3FTx-Oxy5; AltName: Full=Three-finger toxin; Short=3FTx; Flags: Precursor [Oxyuranus microlepidotus]ABU68553.1 3FTx-Oxy5 [Oxyuranus microlepidotus]
MKTLLLTLVVMTIVCLDLGYTLTCYMNPSGTMVCKEHETMCYRLIVWTFQYHVLYLKGCSSSCPGGNNCACCSTDLCNN